MSATGNTEYDTPRCTDRETYEQWLVLARLDGELFPRAGFCIDCTPAYQAEMKCLERCAHPRIKFKHNFEGVLVGYMPNQQRDEQLDRIEQRQRSIINWYTEVPDV